MGSRYDQNIRKQVTVVIPNYNGKEYLKGCLDSLLKGSEVPRILVVDNGSSDGSAEMMRDNYPDVQVMALGSNTGFCHAVNAGIRAAKTRFVLLLNNDIVVDRDCVKCLYEAILQNAGAFSVQAKMLSMKDPGVIDDAGDYYSAMGWAFARGKAKNAEFYERPEKIFSACAGAAIYRRKVFEKIGYFDERHFCYLEDVDVGYRARIYGFENLYDPRAIVWHAGSASSGAIHNPFKEEMTSGNNMYLLYKNMPVFQYALNLPLICLGREIKRAYFVRKGLGDSYRKGLQRGKVLCNRAKSYDNDRKNGTLISKRSLREEASLNGREDLDKVNPLYLGRKVPFQKKHIPNYIRIQFELWKNCLKRLS